LLDFSFNSQDINTFLNLESKFDINYIYSNIENSDEKLFLSLLNQYKDTSLYVFSTNENINVDFNFTPEITTKIINSLKNIFAWIIIDTSSIINETSVSIINNSDIVLLIGLLNLSSIRNCQKCYELFDNIGYKDDKIKLIVNRFIENSELTINDIKNTLDKNVFYKIPNNYLTLIDAINIGATVEETNPQSNIAKAYKDLAHEILNIDFMSIKEKEKTNYNHGIFNLLRRMGE
jgi:pilus assembly protein CpaE